MPVSGFKILHELGVLQISESSNIRFSIDEFKGHKYGSIRKYLKRESYQGPTRSGITLTLDIVDKLIEDFSKLSRESQLPKEREMGRYQKRPGTFVVSRITTYQNITSIDLREWQEDVSYTGWTKRGIRLPLKNLDSIMEYLNKMKEFISSK
jgi:Transcriptional Coactivator p15 (PC4)